LPDDLVEEAMHVTRARTKTEMIRKALINLIDQHKRERILRYHEKLVLDVDLDALRDR
jgi:hypothetical protein